MFRRRRSPRLRPAGMSEDFAITHLNQVVKEFGVFIEVNKSRPPNPHAPLRMLVDEVPDPPMRETRELKPAPESRRRCPQPRSSRSWLSCAWRFRPCAHPGRRFAPPTAKAHSSNPNCAAGS